MSYYIGFDVGSQSVRAAVVDRNGAVLQTVQHSIEIWNPKPEFYEQSSDDIWNACCICSKALMKNYSPLDIGGIGFTATCSLVVLDSEFQPLSISPTGNRNQNIIMWMDHRAHEETEYINQLKSPLLQYFGGSISIEMQPPKLLWFKKNMPDQWKKAKHFMDLPDFLTWRATNSCSRSLCSAVCKWTYQATGMSETEGWDVGFWTSIGLDDIATDLSRIGLNVVAPGTPVGQGVSVEVSDMLSFKPGTPVGASLIDAYAGALGLFACTNGTEPQEHVLSRLALICGTSTCHIALSKQLLCTPGVWGPYRSVLVSGLWAAEGGQSATGKLLDHVIHNHPAYTSIMSRVKTGSVYEELNALLFKMQTNLNLPSIARLTSSLHVFPDFYGNRSPLADPSLKGMISGLTLNAQESDLLKVYLATLQALAYETRFIISSLEDSGHSFHTLLLCGGLSKNNVFNQTLADVTGFTVIKPLVKESVLLGAAVLGCKAQQVVSNNDLSFEQILMQMGGEGTIYKPNTQDRQYHDCKYRVYMKMLHDQLAYRSIMDEIKANPNVVP